jgi:hypothetical protein
VPKQQHSRSPNDESNNVTHLPINQLGSAITFPHNEPRILHYGKPFKAFKKEHPIVTEMAKKEKPKSEEDLEKLKLPPIPRPEGEPEKQNMPRSPFLQ